MLEFSNNMINNRPVLLWADRSVITINEMKSSTFDFQVTELYRSALITNARHVEDAVQTRLNPLTLGLRRLHRKVGKGQKYPDKLGVPRCHKVFITTCAKVQDLIKNGTIIVTNKICAISYKDFIAPCNTLLVLVSLSFTAYIPMQSA